MIPLRIQMHEKKIYLMSQILHKNNLGDRIPKGSKKKKPDNLNSKKGNSIHALIAINSSPNAWIVDSGESHHMDSSKEIYSSLDACKGPSILMGDNSSVKFTDKGRIELTNGMFENVLYIPKLSSKGSTGINQSKGHFTISISAPRGTESSFQLV
jgi:hypothetical protein